MLNSANSSVTFGLKQLQRIHVLVKQLGWSDDIYRSALDGFCGVDSAKKLTQKQAAEFIAHLTELLSPHRASTRQVWKIRTLWAMIDYSKMQEGDKHLTEFLNSRFKVVKPEWLTPIQAWNCIQVIERMVIKVHGCVPKH